MMYGFEQYDFPVIEPFEIFAAKSGEELVNDQLYAFEDKGGRKIAVRPELTPGTTRMIAQRYKEIPQPIKWFMIGNNWRYEKPQTGRGREFYQLEVNIFGVPSVTADYEIFKIIISIMEAFCAKKEMYTINISDRRLITALLSDSLKLNETDQIKIRRLMDKKNKMSEENFSDALKGAGLNNDQASQVTKFMNSGLEDLSNSIPNEILENNEGYKNIIQLFDLLKEGGIEEYCQFDPGIIRGFDYSDGLVYEVFDTNPENRRSLFGGERFDRLINIFGDFDLPATGFAMGDYTLLEFLKGWDLLPDMQSVVEYLVTVWPSERTDYLQRSFELSDKIREKGKKCVTWLDTNTKLDKQLRYADKKGIRYAVIVGEEELSTNTATIKDLNEGTQTKKPLEKFLADIE
jgi:histidyl-tRNA synthetase